MIFFPQRRDLSLAPNKIVGFWPLNSAVGGDKRHKKFANGSMACSSPPLVVSVDSLLLRLAGVFLPLLSNRAARVVVLEIFRDRISQRTECRSLTSLKQIHKVLIAKILAAFVFVDAFVEIG